MIKSEDIPAAALKLLAGIDWELLRQQKHWLCRNPSTGLDVPDQETEAIEGLLALLDAIQDFAVDMLGLSEQQVFGPDFGKEDEDGATP